MCWNPIYILLIVLSTVVDYFVGLNLGKEIDFKKRRKFLYLSLIANVGILFYFKYYNFLRDNLQDLFDLLSINAVIPDHNFLLPVGISFYTFQTLSYTIDIYKNRLKPEKKFINFALYVSFFPQLVAGPIERSTSLLPQLKKLHDFDYDMVRYGMLLILWGMFKKVVIADRLAIYADLVFNDPIAYNGLATMVGAICFSFQIYCDFSGYSDIAIGSSKVLGIDLMENFKGPYFSRSIREFWQRWHISLSTWFRDYVYIPLGGSRITTLITYRNLTIVFLVTGIWHGANWTFIVWGLYHGFFLLLERLGLKTILDSMPSFIQIIYVFVISTIGWVFFRAENLDSALDVLYQMLVYDPSNFFNIETLASPIKQFQLNLALVLIVIIWIMHYFEYRYNIIENITKMVKPMRWTIYLLLILAIFNFGSVVDVPFVYFQF